MSTPHHASRHAASLAALLTLFLVAPPAYTATTPDQGPGKEPAPLGAEAIQTPTVPIDFDATAVAGRGALTAFLLTPLTDLDRGSVFTDACREAPRGLNALERAKLDMARAAQAAVASRLIPLPGSPLPARPADIEALKLSRLAVTVPRPFPQQAGPDGVGGGLPPLQKIGPLAPSAAELLKRDRVWPSDGNPNAPAKPAAEEAEARVTAEPEQAEVQR